MAGLTAVDSIAAVADLTVLGALGVFRAGVFDVRRKGEPSSSPDDAVTYPSSSPYDSVLPPVPPERLLNEDAFLTDERAFLRALALL